jgi:hypothetical protein
MIAALGVAEAVVLAAIGLLHFYWSAGGRWARAAAVPEIGGRLPFQPRPLGTAAVGALLFFAAALVCWTAGVWGAGSRPHGLLRLPAAVLAAVFIVRAIGDRHSVGFLKRIKGTPFAELDSRIYSPLSLLLGLGAAVIVVS